MTSDTATAAPGRAGRFHDAERPRHPAVWVLGVGVAATVVGTALSVYRGDGSSINAFLFLDLGLSHEAAARLERVSLGAVTLAAVIGLAWPRWFLLVPVAAYLLLEAVAGHYVRGYAFSELTPLAHSLRYLAPLALVLLAGSIESEGGRPEVGPEVAPEAALRTTVARSPASLVTGAWLLRVGLAAIFLAHGYEALQLHPEFIDLVITSGENLLGTRIEEATASTALRAIGVVDMVIASLLLIRPWRAVLAWMLLWGLVTAISRMTSYGWGAHTDVLMRFTHFTVPLALLLIVASRSRLDRLQQAG